MHLCKEETLQVAYRLARQNNGAPGIDGVTFAMIERDGVDSFLAGIREELLQETYLPMRNRRKEIPGNGKVRVLGIPCIRDRVVGPTATARKRKPTRQSIAWPAQWSATRPALSILT